MTANEIYNVIYDASVKGYHLADSTYGLPWIERSDVEAMGEGLFVVRFRCPVERTHDVFFGAVDRDVRNALGAETFFAEELKRENGIPFAECVWVINVPDGKKEGSSGHAHG